MKTAVVLIGSSRFMNLIHRVRDELIPFFRVTAPPFPILDYTSPEGQWADAGLMYDHLFKVAAADVVIVVNPDGYIGNNSIFELGYAVARNKLIVLCEESKEPFADRFAQVVVGGTEPVNIRQAVTKYLTRSK